MAKKQPQKKLSELENERSQRFQASIEKIKNGQSRKQAILSSGMDPRTFNKIINQTEDKGTLYLTKIDKKGHYRISGTSTMYAKWEVLSSDGNLGVEFVDEQTTYILSRYWNTVRSDLSGQTNGLDIFTPNSIYNIYGDKIQLETDYASVYRWHSRLLGTQAQRFINDNIYERSTVVG